MINKILKVYHSFKIDYQKVQTSSYKINKYWGCNVQRDVQLLYVICDKLLRVLITRRNIFYFFNFVSI